MTTLTDIQIILLSTAASRPDGSLLPPPESLGTGAARIRKTVATLISRGFAQEILAADGTDFWREEDGQGIAVVITDTGRAAIAPGDSDGSQQSESAAPANEAPLALPAYPTKTAMVIDLLSRAEGATLDDLVRATGWLPHTMRAALTGLRKKGHQINKGKRSDITCYELVQAA